MPTLARAYLKSAAPYSQSRFHQTPKKVKEGDDDYEKRTWREKCHTDKDGHLYIPPMAFKNALSTAATFRSEKIKGRGVATYTKHFLAGVLVVQPLILPLRKDDIPGEWIHANPQGQRGGSKRVMRCFPVIHEWEGDVEFIILDSTITRDVFERHLVEAGNLVGIGRFRCEKGGFYGRFKVERLDWVEG